MKKLTTSLCLILLVSLGVAGTSFALPPCPSSYNQYTWTDCYGTYIWGNGDKYSGRWSDGVFHGLGHILWTDGEKYDGNFKNGKKHGQGTYRWANGEQYSGKWRNGKIHGRGTWHSPLAGSQKIDRYIGEWTDSKRHGHGIYYYADGRIEEGFWENGELPMPWWKFW